MTLHYSQKWLAIISLDHPTGSEFGSGDLKVKAKRKLGTHNKYETKALHWNPNSNKQTLLVSTVCYHLLWKSRYIINHLHACRWNVGVVRINILLKGRGNLAFTHRTVSSFFVLRANCLYISVLHSDNAAMFLMSAIGISVNTNCSFAVFLSRIIKKLTYGTPLREKCQSSQSRPILALSGL